MIKENLSRREVIRLLSLAGFSLYLPACHNSTPESTVPASPIVDSLDTSDLEQDTLVSESQSRTSPNVNYYSVEDDQYLELNNSFNLRTRKKPGIMALCENTEGVREAVLFAKQEGLEISIKSGGHSFEGFSSNDGGIQINLSLLNEINWLENEMVSIGPGCLLRDIYDELLPKNRIVPAGSCGTVGLGGLALGGGYGFFARKYGLTCDSLVEATMVDGNGIIHQTKNGEDLMWALKGGGNGNFGIVSELKFKTHPAPKFFTRHRFKAFKLDVERARTLLQEWFAYTNELPDHAFSAFVLNGKTLTLLITHYEKGDEAIQKMINKFKDLSDKASIGGERALAKSLKTYYGVQEPIFFKNASAGYYSSFSDIDTCIDKVLEKVISSRGLIYQVNTLGGNIDSKSFEDNSCYPHRALPYLSELQAYWEEGRSSESLVATFAEIQNHFYDHGIRTQYRNYPDLNFKDWETAYFGEENYPKLQKIKQRYDPENNIRHPQSIKPLNS